MRLEAQAKIGFYPTPDKVLNLISQMIYPVGSGKIRILDPCAGKGFALKHIGEALQAETFGIEIDSNRAQEASQHLHHCLNTDYQAAVISQRAFSLLFLNPPYDWSIKDDDMAPSERYELAFLRDTFKYLIPFGVLIYLIPHHRLDKKIAQILAWHFSDVKVFRFPSEEYERFRQIVIFGVMKKQAEWNRELSLELQEMGKNPDIPFLNRSEASYTIPLNPNVHRFVFRTRELDKDQLYKELTLSPLKEKIRKMVSPVYLSEKIKPIMPLRKGHLAQILACGLMNDVVFDRNGRNPLVIKGITHKSTDTSVEYNDGTEKTIETDRIIISVTAISEYGEITDLS